MPRSPFLIALATCGMLLPATTQTPSAAEIDAVPIKCRASDCHPHLVDFLQQTDGIQTALEAMKKTGVDNAVISGIPLARESLMNETVQPQRYLDDKTRCCRHSATDVLVANDWRTDPS